MAYHLPILEVRQVTHDVKQFILSKPEEYSFTPGQATEVAIDKDGWREEKRPFTFTSLPDEKNLEFTIKIYSDHQGVTDQLNKLTTSDTLIIDEPWGTIEYKGTGIFLAGGAGITPFISIIRHLHKLNRLEGNQLIFSNKTEKDIILRNEFEEILGENFINVITESNKTESDNTRLYHLDGFIDRTFLEDLIDDVDKHFYVCGPPAFNKSMMKYLKEMGADPQALVFEE